MGCTTSKKEDGNLPVYEYGSKLFHDEYTLIDLHTDTRGESKCYFESFAAINKSTLAKAVVKVFKEELIEGESSDATKDPAIAMRAEIEMLRYIYSF